MSKKSGIKIANDEVHQLEEALGLGFRDAQAKRKAIMDSGSSVKIFLENRSATSIPSANDTMGNLNSAKDFTKHVGRENAGQILEEFLELTS